MTSNTGCTPVSIPRQTNCSTSSYFLPPRPHSPRSFSASSEQNTMSTTHSFLSMPHRISNQHFTEWDSDFSSIATEIGTVSNVYFVRGDDESPRFRAVSTISNQPLLKRGYEPSPSGGTLLTKHDLPTNSHISLHPFLILSVDTLCQFICPCYGSNATSLAQSIPACYISYRRLSRTHAETRQKLSLRPCWRSSTQLRYPGRPQSAGIPKNVIKTDSSNRPCRRTRTASR